MDFAAVVGKDKVWMLIAMRALIFWAILDPLQVLFFYVAYI